MKKFKGNRSQKEIVKNMKMLGYTWTRASRQAYKNGSDFNGFVNGEGLFVLLSTFNGRFSVKDLNKNKVIATESSSELDEEKWYNDLLNAFYITEEKTYESI